MDDKVLDLTPLLRPTMNTDVLIVGPGLAGASLACFLTSARLMMIPRMR